MSLASAQGYSKPGMIPRRRCDQKEQELIKSVYDDVKAPLIPTTNATVWFNIYVDGKYNVALEGKVK